MPCEKRQYKFYDKYLLMLFHGTNFNNYIFHKISSNLLNMTRKSQTSLKQTQIKLLAIGTIISAITFVYSTIASIVDLNLKFKNYQLSLLKNDFNPKLLPRFIPQCSEDNKCSYVVYKNSSGIEFKWFDLRKLGGDYTEIRRATVISNRLEQYRLEKMLTFEKSELNNHKIICVRTSQNIDSCQMVITIPPEIDVNEVLLLLDCKNKNLDIDACKEAISS